MEPGDPTENQLVRKSEFSPKLTEEERVQVCEWVAQFKPFPLIQEFIKQRFGKELTLQSIYGYAAAPKWKSLIYRCRQEWAAGVMELPLAHKRARIDELSKLYERAQQNQGVSEFARIMQSLSILREIRCEMEEAKTQFTNVFMTQINQMTDEELIQRREELRAKIKQWRPPNKTIDTQPEHGETT